MATTAPTPPPVRVWGLVALLALYLVIAYLVPRPDAITPQGWRTAAIFASVIVGMIIEPLPASALVLLGLTAMTANGTTMRETLGGFAEPSVWLVIVAMLIARSMLDSGLARRIALVFIRGVGRSSLGISYALLMTDVTLASGVPSITARSAGMLLPIARRIAELSTPIRARPPAASARFWWLGSIKARRWRARCSSPGRRATCSGPTSRESS